MSNPSFFCILAIGKDKSCLQHCSFSRLYCLCSWFIISEFKKKNTKVNRIQVIGFKIFLTDYCMRTDLISGQKVKQRRNSLQMINLFLVMTPPSLKSTAFQDKNLNIIVSLNSSQCQEDLESRVWISSSLSYTRLAFCGFQLYLVWGFSRTHSILIMLAAQLLARLHLPVSHPKFDTSCHRKFGVFVLNFNLKAKTEG